MNDLKMFHRTGVVGQPRVRNSYVRMHGPSGAPAMPDGCRSRPRQYNFVENPARLFYLNASMSTIPVQGYHRYVGPSASMTVKAAALVPVVQVSRPEIDQGETVTMFNDMCVLAPATLIDPAIVWEPVDDRAARARFTNAGHTIRAELSFTPLSHYRSFGPVRLASGGQARWHEPSGDYAYIELTLDDVEYNVRSQ